MIATQEDGQTSFEWKGAELCVCAVIQLMLIFLSYRFDRTASSLSLISESSWAIFFGLIFGSVLALLSPVEAGKAGLSPETFFWGLLPPIILQAGFSLKKRGFFANFFTILSLAVIGTLVSTFFTGSVIYYAGSKGLITPLTSAESYMFGSLISAVDPVATLSIFKKFDAPPLLFNLVFGESVLNDGVSIVAFSIFQHLATTSQEAVTVATAISVSVQIVSIAIGSVLLAATVCSVSAFCLKAADVKNLSPPYEISIILLSAYLSYGIADLLHLSGIVALFFSGVLMSHYHLYTLSPSSANALTQMLGTLSFLAENFIFLYLGVSVVAYSSNFMWDWKFIGVTLMACVIGRALNTFPLCTIANLKRKTAIPHSFMVVIWFSGLRGAIAFSLALNVGGGKYHRHNSSAVIQSTTLFITMFTTIVFGTGTAPLLRYLKPTTTAVSSEEPLAKTAGGIHSFWEKIDEEYLKPVFGGNPRSISNDLSEKLLQNP